MIKAIIVDDEQPARELISNLVNRYFNTQIQIVSKCSSVNEAKEAISTHHPNLVFLDITMPGNNGFELLKSNLKRNFEVIFITAHNDYAIKAFKYSAFDYLLKPIDLDEFQNSVSRAIDRVKENNMFSSCQLKGLLENLGEQQPKKIWVQSEKEIRGILVSEILFCKAAGAYSEIKLKDSSVVLSSKSLKEMADVLKDASFIKTHKSYLVNKENILRIVKGENWTLELESGGTETIPISHRRRKEVNEQVVS